MVAVLCQASLSACKLLQALRLVSILCQANVTSTWSLRAWGGSPLLTRHDLMDLRKEWEVPWKIRCLPSLRVAKCDSERLGALPTLHLVQLPTKIVATLAQDWPLHSIDSIYHTPLGVKLTLSPAGIVSSATGQAILLWPYSFKRERALSPALPTGFLWVLPGYSLLGCLYLSVHWNLQSK